MSLENVKAFYQRLATDEAFLEQIQSVKTKEECSQIVKNAGYNFTQEELESYTAQLIESNQTEGELRDLDKKELELVAGGIAGVLKFPWFQPMYGVVQPLYGVVISNVE